MEGNAGSGGTNPPPLTQCCDCSQCAQSNMETSFLRLVLLLVLFFLLTGDYTSIFGQIYQLLGGEDPPSNRVAVKKTRDASKVPPTGDDADETLQILSTAARLRLMSTIKNSCLPKLICELNASPYREKLSESEKSLLSLIRDTSISVTAEVTSKYHFAAHMGQLIAGVDGAGCHNFYPSCPFPNMQVLNMMKKVRLR